MTAHAALIAAKLQGAHERRQRGEDKDMGKDEGVWAEAARQIEQALTMVRENVERGLPDEDAPQSNAVTAERVVALERELAQANAHRDEAVAENERVVDLLRTAYVAREVGWSDVAAGMMTIARDGAAWMVAEESAGVFQLQSGTRAFAKTPKPGETVRVLVPYVTPEQAETAVREQLGGTAVS